MTTHTSSLFALLAMSLAGALAADGFETAGCISAAQRDSMVVVSVLDWGRGIAAEDLPRIFDRFYRPSLGRKPGGIGLGLYITRALVEAQGGHISVESEVGRGSTFTLPVPPRDEDQA